MRQIAERTQPLLNTLRSASAFALAATVLASLFGPPSQVRAAEADPRARLELVVKQVNVIDNREAWTSGSAELNLKVDVVRCKGDTPSCQGTRLAGVEKFFSADDGDVKTLDLKVPNGGDPHLAEGTSPELGFPIHPGDHYHVSFEMEEWDYGCVFNGASCILDDDLGEVVHVLNDGELGLGTHTRRSTHPNDENRPGDFVVTYEIRRVPLPDLAPVSIRVSDLPGSPKKRVCMTVVNSGDVDAGPFRVNIDVNGHVPPDGISMVDLLGAGTDTETCVETALSTAGHVVLGAVVDKPRAVTEFNETNNVHLQTYAFALTSTSLPSSSTSSSPPSPTPTSQDQADLTVSAIRVNGQVPDDKDDCKDGKNTVAIVVKNAGTGKAGAFAVRLDADGDDAGEQSVDGLDAGKEREVRFEDVRLKKGGRKLTATVDAKNTVTESKEENNELKVTAACKDDD